MLDGIGGRDPGGGKPQNPPPSEAGGAVAKSVVPLDGPAEVFGEFRVVDLPVLASLLAREPEAVQKSAISWSIQWNRYVTCACSHAHFARRWSDLVRVVGVADGGLLLKSTLRKINGEVRECEERKTREHRSYVTNSPSSSQGDEQRGLEPTVAKPLADVVLDLVGEVAEAGQEVDDGVVRGIAEAIGNVGEEELTGLLSSALTLSLPPPCPATSSRSPLRRFTSPCCLRWRQGRPFRWQRFSP